MTSGQQTPWDDDEGAPAPPDPFEPDPVDEAELWFLPGPSDDLLPLPARGARLRAAVADPGPWRRAQGARARALADLAGAMGTLSARLQTAGQGAVRRLAAEEAAALSWWVGDRVAPDRLAAHLAGHLRGPAEDALPLSRAAWALRRLAGSGPDPAEDLAGFLERPGPEAPDESMPEASAAGTYPPADPELHPLVVAAQVFAAARPATADPARAIEAAVLAARIGAPPVPGAGAGTGAGAAFLPLALGGIRALEAKGPPEARLGPWIEGARLAVLAALMRLDRLAAWQARAEAATAGLSGRTPPRLIAALAAHPVLAAPEAEAATGASRAAVQRNLDRLAALDLVREVTGQGRYRLWTARL